MMHSYQMTPVQAAIAHVLAKNANHNWAGRFSPEMASQIPVQEIAREMGYDPPVMVDDSLSGCVIGFKPVQCGCISWEIFPNGDVILRLSTRWSHGKREKNNDVLRAYIRDQKVDSVEMLEGVKESQCTAFTEVLAAMGYKAEDINVASGVTVTITLASLFKPALKLLQLPAQVTEEAQVK